jgi:hypothetical protein
MNGTRDVEASVHDACKTQSRIIVILKNHNEWYEGVVEKIHENRIVKFVTRVPHRSLQVTGFLLMSDILEVLY